MYFQPALWLLIVQYPQTDRNKEELGASPPPAVQQGSVYQGKPKTSSDFAIGITVISFKEEETMKKSLVITAVVSLLVGLLAGVFFTLHVTTSSASADQQKVVHVVEHAITDTVQEFHPPNMSLGDVLGFHNPVFNAADTTRSAWTMATVFGLLRPVRLNGSASGWCSWRMGRSLSRGLFLMMAPIRH